MEQIIFGTPEWYDVVLEEVRKAIDRKQPPAGTKFTLLERYTDPPPEFALRDGWEQGYFLEIEGRNARLRVGVRADETADVIITLTWDAVYRLVLLPYGPEFDVLAKTLLDQGQFRLDRGDLASAPISFQEVHDGVCRRTARN